jgi:Zn-dependent peptidase ImmA (M78 family)
MKDVAVQGGKPWLNPKVLRSAREWRGRTVEEAAEKINKRPEDVIAWETNAGAPTVRQARILAEFYGRAFLEFFLPELPVVPLPALVPDYRMQAGVPPPTDNRELQALQQWAETQRLNALDLFDELGEQAPQIPQTLFKTLSSDASEATKAAREALKFSIQDQIRLTKSQADGLPNILRRKFETLGILTLKHTDLKDFGVRGICIADFPLPVIVFRNEAPSAQAFTLAHELAHVITKQSGITGPRSVEYDGSPVEKWADKFAAAFLMPAEQIEAVFDDRPALPADVISDEHLNRLAEIFRVSPHAMMIRLVHLGYVRSSYYWQIKKPQFDADEREYRSYGRSRYYGSRYKSRLGDLYTGLVLEVWSTGKITNHNAAEYMGIKNISHLNDIRDHFSVS